MRYNLQAVYVTTVSGCGYAGRTGVKLAETAEEAVRDRIAAHVRKQTRLGEMIASGPGLEQSLSDTAISVHRSDEEAIRAVQAAYDAIPSGRRLNSERPR